MSNKDYLNDPQSALDVAGKLVSQAKSAGADQAEAVFSHGRNSSLTFRQGEVTDLQQAENLSIALRVWVGDRLASISGNQMDAAGLKDLAEQCVARARLLPANPDITIPAHPDTPTRTVEMDTTELSLEELRKEAEKLHDGAMAVKGIHNSDGGNSGWGKMRSAIVTSHGLNVSSARSSFFRSITAEAGEGDTRAIDYDGNGKSHFEDLKPIESLIETATRRVLSKVGAKPIAGFQGDVVFEPRMAKSLFAGFLGGINGAAIARGQSFLKDKLGQQIFASSVNLVDDPSLYRGAASRIIDSEGHVPMPLQLVEDGVLKTWLLDRRSAKKLEMTTNARAARGGGGSINPSSTNLLATPGAQSQHALISGIKRGLLITEMMGQGLNPISGDYSRGAGGFLIEDGELSVPVQAMTVADNMLEMFARMIFCDDLDSDGALHVPSILVPEMKIAGLS